MVAGVVGADKELLEDLGLNILEDSNSRDSAASAASSSSGKPPPPASLYQHINLVLKPKDTNVPPIHPAEIASPYYISDDSFNCSVGATTLSRRLAHHSYALTADNSVSDEFFMHSRKSLLCSRRQSEEDVFSKMADEIVLLVFRWLPKVTLAKCALVCKRWYRLCQDESLWKRLDLGLRTVPPGVVGQIMSRGCSVLRLARSTLVPPVFRNPATGQTTFSSSLSKLQFLDLSMATVELSCLERILNSCRSLRKLSLENVPLSEACCLAIGLNPGLEVLHLAMCTGFTLPGLNMILMGCANISELNLSWAELTEAEVRLLCSSLTKKLERLCLAGYREKIQDADILNLVRCAPLLRELDVSDATLLTAQTISLVVDHLPRLESLSTSRCYKITPSSYLLLRGCPTLLYLNVFRLLRDLALEELKSKLPGIEINRHLFSAIARPTVGIRRTSIWELRVRD